MKFFSIEKLLIEKKKNLKKRVKELNKKLISLTLLAILAIGSLASVYAYQEYITTWEGVAHEHCGHDASTPSEDGSLVLTLSETGNLEPYQIFNVSLSVSNFTEALEEPYGGYVMLGIPGLAADDVVMDNDKFSSPLGIHILNRRESLDTWGSINEDTKLESRGNPSPMDCTFTLLAPGEAGTYTLMGLAIAGVNQSTDFADTVEHAEVDIIYVEGTITIKVVGSAGGSDDAIPGFITIVLMGSIGVTILAVVLVVRRKKRILK